MFYFMNSQVSNQKTPFNTTFFDCFLEILKETFTIRKILLTIAGPSSEEA